MKNSEKLKFEEAWRDAFEDAEMDPSKAVWNNLDLQLSHQENGYMKRRVILYQRLIAASLVAALLLGGSSYWYWKGKVSPYASVDKIPDVNTKTPEPVDQTTLPFSMTEPTSATSSTNYDQVDKRDEVGGSENNSKDADGNERVTQAFNSSGSHFLAVTSNNFKQSDETFLKHEGNPKENGSEAYLAHWTEEELRLSTKPYQEVSSPIILPRSAFVKVETKKKPDQINDDWIASIGGSTGGYSSGSGGVNSASAKTISRSLGPTNADPMSQRESGGVSYSVGMTFGKRIATRWMLMSGFNYMNQSIGYNSNVTTVDVSNQPKAFLTDLAAESVNISTTIPYTLNSVNEFFSIPLQAGYLVVDRKFGFQLNAGMAADFFIKNTLADERGTFSDYSQGPGSSSSYRSVNWAGLFGTELNYKLNKHYKVSMVPGVRYSFTSVLKQSTGSTLKPFVWDIGFRFGYTF